MPLPRRVALRGLPCWASSLHARCSHATGARAERNVVLGFNVVEDLPSSLSFRVTR